jgi:hypothetical protein
MGLDLVKLTVTCDWCEDTYTKADLDNDHIRFHRTTSGLLCELCKEDFDEGRR